MHRVYAYLIKQRFIAPEIITHFARLHTLYEDKEHHNAVFVGFDENGVPRQAHKRSTNSYGKTFRITCEGSDTRYSFAHFGESEKLFVFEAPIDLLSYLTLHPENWQQHSYIAMNGVYENAVLMALEHHSSLDEIILCTDNDKGGIDAVDRLTDILKEHGYENISRIIPENKDFNEDLKERNGIEPLKAVPHKRKDIYYETVSDLQHFKCSPDRLIDRLSKAFRNGRYRYLAEYALAGSALFAADQAMMSIISTALSRLNSFIDSELEQILCFGTAIDAEKFCNEKSAIFIVLPEEDISKYFMVSLIIQQLYREILVIADENGGKLKNRVMFFCDEFGSFPKIEGAEAMFSASRSRRISIVAIIQSFAQLDKNYGREGQEIITDNTQLTIFGGFAPNSQSAEVLSKALGEQTVLSGTVSHGRDKSQSLQMIGRPLMTPDELKSMPKGQFIVMKTGTHPMISPLKLYFKWGIEFEEPYILEDKGARKVTYMSKDGLMREVEMKYPQKKKILPVEFDVEFDEELPKRRKPLKTGGV